MSDENGITEIKKEPRRNRAKKWIIGVLVAATGALVVFATSRLSTSFYTWLAGVDWKAWSQIVLGDFLVGIASAWPLALALLAIMFRDQIREVVRHTTARPWSRFQVSSLAVEMSGDTPDSEKPATNETEISDPAQNLASANYWLSSTVNMIRYGIRTLNGEATEGRAIDSLPEREIIQTGFTMGLIIDTQNKDLQRLSYMCEYLIRNTDAIFLSETSWDKWIRFCHQTNEKISENILVDLNRYITERGTTDPRQP